MHRLKKRDVRKIKGDVQRGKFLCVKRSLNCPKCKLIKRGKKIAYFHCRFNANFMDLDIYLKSIQQGKDLFLNFTNREMCCIFLLYISARRRYYTDLANGGASEEESAQSNTGADEHEDTTVVALGKEPVHQPISEAAPGSPQSSLKPSSDSPVQNIKPKEASITKHFSLAKRKDESEFQEISSRTPSVQRETKDAHESRLNEIENNDALTVVRNQTCFASHGSLEYDRDVWTDPADIKSEDDLLMMLEEFQSRKEVHVCKCGIMYMDHTSFWLHKNNAHKQDNIFACGICSKDCGSSEELQVHLNDTSCERRDALPQQ